MVMAPVTTVARRAVKAKSNVYRDAAYEGNVNVNVQCHEGDVAGVRREVEEGKIVMVIRKGPRVLASGRWGRCGCVVLYVIVPRGSLRGNNQGRGAFDPWYAEPLGMRSVCLGHDSDGGLHITCIRACPRPDWLSRVVLAIPPTLS